MRPLNARQFCAAAHGDERTESGLLGLRTHTGGPLGSDRFLSKLETAPGYRVRPLPRGRPKKMAWQKGPQ
jgi:hypothetical protein